MKIYDSEKFLKKRLIEEASYSYYTYQKAKQHPLKEREVFCFMVRIFCENHYYNKKISNSSYINYFRKNIKKEKDGWYSVDKSFGKGRFVHANKLFKDVYCEEAMCHECAYYFALEAPIKVELVFGSINPFRINNGVFHSICLFKLYDKEYVFDASSYMVMEKDLYYRVFNFMEMQKISQDDLIEDRKVLSQEPVLKQNRYYKYANMDALNKRFYGLGFLTYLYNRNDFLSNNDKQYNNFLTTVKEYKVFKDNLREHKDKFTSENLTVADILNEKYD